MRSVGAVLIGRNEGERLERALRACCKQTDRVVYVDSGSTDGSVAYARSIGVEVVELDMDEPFTAARGRNAGAERLLGQHPDTTYVQFVDGDCELVPGWLEHGVIALEGNDKLAVVCGRLREVHPEHSVYNRLIDLEWDTPIGPAESCGGIAMFRISAFADVGRFDATVAAGEEPELCMRLRAAGWLIERIDHDMAMHDAAITKLSQWMRRSVRTGRGSLDLVTRFGDNGSGFGKIVKRARLWGFCWPFLLLLGTLATGIGLGFAYGLGVGLAGAFAAMSLLIWPGLLKVAYGFLRGAMRGMPYSTAFYNALLDLLSKFAEVWGQWGYMRDQKRGRTTRLIEYKNAPAATHDGAAVEAKQA
ncbi:glycosyltransferase family A protein [Phycisphaeraceae bacterium D3-23]